MGATSWLKVHQASPILLLKLSPLEKYYCEPSALGEHLQVQSFSFWKLLKMYLFFKVILNYISLNSFYYQQNSAFNIFYIISLNQICFQSTLKPDFSQCALWLLELSRSANFSGLFETDCVNWSLIEESSNSKCNWTKSLFLMHFYCKALFQSCILLFFSR